jgi:hypothetical protein
MKRTIDNMIDLPRRPFSKIKCRVFTLSDARYATEDELLAEVIGSMKRIIANESLYAGLHYRSYSLVFLKGFACEERARLIADLACKQVKIEFPALKTRYLVDSDSRVNDGTFNIIFKSQTKKNKAGFAPVHESESCV